MNDDFGAQEALQVSPQMYRDLFKPRQRRWIEFVRTRTPAKIFLHCDGAVEELLGDFIEIGIDILNPLQTSCAGRTRLIIKSKYGRNLSFWGGGVETQSTLPFGSIDEIRDQVRSRIEILSPGGGYVFSPIHNIQADLAPDKILAVFSDAQNQPLLVDRPLTSRYTTKLNNPRFSVLDSRFRGNDNNVHTIAWSRNNRSLNLD